MPAFRPAERDLTSAEPDRHRSLIGRQTPGEPARRRQALHEPTRPTTYQTLRTSARTTGISQTSRRFSDDTIDVRPDGVSSATWSALAEAEVESYHGIDVSYGGWDQDAAKASVAASGPIGGDRILDRARS